MHNCIPSAVVSPEEGRGSTEDRGTGLKEFARKKLNWHLRYYKLGEGTPEPLAISNQAHLDYMVLKIMRRMRKPHWEL